MIGNRRRVEMSTSEMQFTVGPEKPRIGILTGGGDCPGLNAVIRGAVKTAVRLGYEVVGFINGYEGLAPPVRYRSLDLQNTAGILIQGGTILGSTNRGRFASKVGVETRRFLPEPLIQEVRKTFEQVRLAGLICVGGDGTLTTAQELFDAGLPVVGIPKTIDNDLDFTAFTFGFDSAVACAADALDRLHTTAASHARIMILEVMGRHAGWIALHAGIAGGADVILLPEIPWQYEHVVAKVQERKKLGKDFTIIVVAEGAELPSGHLQLQENASDSQVRLGGIGNVIMGQLQQLTGQDTRCVVLGHLQRGGSPTTFDRALATQLGVHGVRLIVEKHFGEMVCYDPPELKSVPIAQAVERLRLVQPLNSAVVSARGMGISFGDAYDHRKWPQA